MEDGLYGELVVWPTIIKPVRLMKGSDKNITFVDALEIHDVGGDIVFVENRRAMRKILRYLLPKTNYTSVPELRRLEWEHLGEVLTEAAKKRGKPLVLKLDDNNKVIGVTSERHMQIPWSTIRDSVEEALERAGIGKVPYYDFSENHWAYMVPSNNEYVDGYIDVYGGTNLGNRAIKISPRTRTISPVGRISAPCLNWSRFWGMVTNWFSIQVTRLKNIITIAGLENLQGLYLRELHVKGTEIDVDYLANQFKSTVNTLNSLYPVIETSMHSELDADECEAILAAYQVTVNLPDYAKEEILNRLNSQGEYTIGM